MSGTLAATLDVVPGHPAFEGHFPGRPILPGVVLLAEAMALAARAAQCAPEELILRRCKFQQPAAPGACLALSCEADGETIAFEIREGEAVVASGTFARRTP